MSDTEKIFVVCYNHSEFQNFLFHRIKKDPTIERKNYIYVNGADSLRGHRNPKGFFYGGWRERKDIKHILMILRVSSEPNNPVLDRITAEIWKTT